MDEPLIQYRQTLDVRAGQTQPMWIYAGHDH
jgi:hypothetical protein